MRGPVRSAALMLSASLALAACQQSEREADAPAAATSTAAPAASSPASPVPDSGPAPAASGTSDAAAPAHLLLEPLAASDGAAINARRPHVGGCQFVDQADRMLLMVGLPDSTSETGVAVARTKGQVIEMATRQRGYQAIEAGPQLAYEGIMLKVTHEGGEGRKQGVETRVWPATLTVSDMDDAAKSYTGSWSCGV